MQQIFSIRSGVLIVPSIRIAGTLILLLFLCVATIKIERLEAHPEELQRQLNDGNNEIVNNVRKGHQFCQFYRTVVLSYTQIKIKNYVIQQ